MCTVCYSHMPYASVGMKFNGSRVFVVLFFETLLYVWESCMDVKVARLNICKIKFSQSVANLNLMVLVPESYKTFLCAGT